MHIHLQCLIIKGLDNNRKVKRICPEIWWYIIVFIYECTTVKRVLFHVCYNLSSCCICYINCVTALIGYYC